MRGKASVTHPFLCCWLCLVNASERSQNLYAFKRFSHSGREDDSNNYLVHNSTTTEEVCHSSYFKLFLCRPHIDGRCRMTEILKVRGRFKSGCVQSSMLHGSETWPIRKENEVALQWAEMRMVRWMCGVKLQDRIPSKGLRERLGLDDIISVQQRNRLRWYGHILQKEDNAHRTGPSAVCETVLYLLVVSDC